MINISNFPLVLSEDCNELFSGDSTWGGRYYIKPKYEFLPDKDDMESQTDYLFKNLKEGTYLTGLDIISDRWLSAGFSRELLVVYGLVLQDANPIIKRGDRGAEESLIYLSFRHISYYNNSDIKMNIPKSVNND